MQGSLTTSYGLGDVIRGVYGGRRSGILSVRRGTLIKQLYFVKGSFVFSDTSDPGWRFGTLLVRRGKLSQGDLDHVLSLLSPGKRIGGVLRELGYLDDAGLAEAVAYQITENVYPAFSWVEGDYSFEEKDEPAPLDIAMAMSTANVIMEGVRRIEDAEFIRRALGPTEQLLTLGSNPLLRFQSIFLKPQEGFVLSRIEGALTVEEVFSLVPVGEHEVLRCLYGLRCTGILEVRAPGASAAAPDEDSNIAGFFSDFAGVEQFLGARAVEKTGEVRLTPEEEKEQQEIQEFGERMASLDLYSILGVDEKADVATIRKAYYRLAKKYHPDRHHKSHLQGLQDRLERIFVRVNEAYETLKDDRHRTAYNRSRAADGRPAAAPPPREEDASDTVRRERLAESSYRDGLRLFERGDLFAAVRALQIATSTDPGKPAYHSALGRALSKNPKWRKEAEEHLLKAVELDPADAESYAQIGALYAAAGLRTRADRYFDEALKRDPTNATALAARGQPAAGKKAVADPAPGRPRGRRGLLGDDQ